MLKKILEKILFFGLLVFLTSIISPGIAHGGAPAQSNEISLSLEEIYFVTLVIMFVTPLVVFRAAKIKDTKFIYVLLAFAFVFLTVDYLILKFIIFA